MDFPLFSWKLSRRGGQRWGYFDGSGLGLGCVGGTWLNRMCRCFIGDIGQEDSWVF